MVGGYLLSSARPLVFRATAPLESIGARQAQRACLALISDKTVITAHLRSSPVAGIAAAVRGAAPFLLLLAILVTDAVAFPKHPSDESGYLTLAHNLTHGQYTGLGWRPANPIPSPDPENPDLWFGPGLPVAIAPLVAIGAPLQVIRLSGPLFLFAAALLFFRLLRLHLPRRLALLGALTLGLYYPFYNLLATLHSEPLAVLLTVAVLYALDRAVHGGGLRYVLLGGLAVAWLSVTRLENGWVTTLLLVGALIWWGIARSARARQVALIFAAGLTLCVPWLIFTYSVTGQPFLWGNSGPLSLYWMSSPYSQDLGDWRGGPEQILITDPLLKPHRAYFRRLAKLDPVEQNKQLESTALSNVRDHPSKFAKNLAANISRLLFNFPYSAKQESLKTLFYLLPNALLLGALLVSALLLAASRSFPTQAVLFLVLGIASFAVHCVLAGYPRFLMPLVPIPVSIVAYAVGRGLVPGGIIQVARRSARKLRVRG